MRSDVVSNLGLQVQLLGDPTKRRPRTSATASASAAASIAPGVEITTESLEGVEFKPVTGHSAELVHGTDVLVQRLNEPWCWAIILQTAMDREQVILPPFFLLDLGLILTSVCAHLIPLHMRPHTRRAPCASQCPCASHADWCLQSDVVSDSRFLFICFVGVVRST